MLPTNPLTYSLFIAPATARMLQLRTQPAMLLLDFNRQPSRTEIDRANDAVESISGSTSDTIYFERGPTDDSLLVTWLTAAIAILIAAAASATAVALAAADARADRATLDSLGAAPRIRRTIAGVQGLLITALGCLLGVGLGLLPAAGLGAVSWDYALWIPWAPLAALLVGLPTAVALTSWTLTHTRHTLGRRLRAG